MHFFRPIRDDLLNNLNLNNRNHNEERYDSHLNVPRLLTWIAALSIPPIASACYFNSPAVALPIAMIELVLIGHTVAYDLTDNPILTPSNTQ